MRRFAARRGRLTRKSEQKKRDLSSMLLFFLFPSAERTISLCHALVPRFPSPSPLILLSSSSVHAPVSPRLAQEVVLVLDVHNILPRILLLRSWQRCPHHLERSHVVVRRRDVLHVQTKACARKKNGAARGWVVVHARFRSRQTSVKSVGVSRAVDPSGATNSSGASKAKGLGFNAVH